MKNVCIDLLGQRFGRLLVVARAQSSRSGTARWDCVCDCGGKKTVQGSHLRGAAVQSCGCMQREATAAINKRHGLAGTPTYITWSGIIARCTDPNTKSYADYGARGIVVDERWLQFDNFLADMGPRPAGMTIERIDNNGPYSPSNCKWATRAEQNNNTRRNRFLTVEGRTQTAAQWSREFGLPARRLLKRIDRYGWSVEKALRTP